MTQAYPLKWPEGWPRTLPNERRNSSPFKMHSDRVRRLLFAEVRLLGGTGLVISSNVPVRQDGMPYADAARRVITDPGVAVFFMRKGRQMSMARDAYWKTEDNLSSITHAIVHLRGLERNGGAYMMERAFTGFAALEAPAGSKPQTPWFEVLGYGPEWESLDLTIDEVEVRFRKKAKVAHPDAGGTSEAMAELNRAMDDAREALREP